jgi:predicted nucleic acid-binding Zn ribbon protein
MSAAKVAAHTSLVKHKHCPICQTPISMSKEFCSGKCEDENKRIGRQRRNRFIMMMLLFPVIFVLLTLIGNFLR